MVEVVVEEEAEDELLQAAIWYETRRAGLARELLEEVGRMVATIRSTPALFPALADVKHERVVRRALLHRFPCALVFVEADKKMHVIALAHAQREKNYWIHRVLDLEK